MLFRLWNFFRGYVDILAKGHFVERFINVCTHRNIYLWDIHRDDLASARMKMSIGGFRKLPEIAKKTHTKIHITKKHGLPIVLHKYRKRYFFLAGVAFLCVFVVVMSQFVWQIELTGNERLSSDYILGSLSELGLYRGCLRRSIDQVDIKNNALMKMDELSWIWVDLRGCKAKVNVLEKSPAPQMIDKNTPCDIVATKAGVIKNLNAKAGQASVKAGDTVLEGQVLISGIMTSEFIEPRYVHSLGNVYARTWEEESDVFNVKREVKTYSGNVQKKYGINLFGWQCNFFWTDGSKFELCDENTYDYDWNLFGLGLGVKWITHEYVQYNTEYVDRSEQEMLDKCGEVLRKRIAERKGSELPEVLAENVIHEYIGDERVKITYTMEFLESIGAEQKLDVSQSEQNIENVGSNSNKSVD